MKPELVLSLFLATIVSISCSDQKIFENKINNKIKNESISDDHELSYNIRDLIVHSSKLSEDQKLSLTTLEDKHAKLLTTLKSDIVKNEMLLARTILIDDIEKKELPYLKANLRKLMLAELKLNEKTIDEAYLIVFPLSRSLNEHSYYNTFMKRQFNSY